MFPLTYALWCRVRNRCRCSSLWSFNIETLKKYLLMYFYHDISLFLVLTVKSSLIRQMLLLHLQMVYWQGLAVFVVAV